MGDGISIEGTGIGEARSEPVMTAGVAPTLGLRVILRRPVRRNEPGRGHPDRLAYARARLGMWRGGRAGSQGASSGPSRFTGMCSPTVGAGLGNGARRTVCREDGTDSHGVGGA